MLTKDPVQKKLFRLSAFLLLTSFAFNFLSNFIYDLYFSSIYGHPYYFGGLEWVLSQLITFVITSGFLVLGLFLCKRWALVTGMIINAVILILSFFANYIINFQSRLENWDSWYDGYEKLFYIENYLVSPLVNLVAVGGMYLCLVFLLLRKRPSAGLQKAAWILTLAGPLYTILIQYIFPAFLENLGMSVLPPVGILSLLIAFAARIFLLVGLAPMPQKPTDHKLGFSGLIALIASMALGVVICLVSMGIYDRVYVYDGFSYTKVLWFLVFLGAIYGMLTAPRFVSARYGSCRPMPVYQPPLEARPSYLPQQQRYQAPQPSYQQPAPQPQYQPQPAPQPQYQPQPAPQPQYQPQPAPQPQPAYQVYTQPNDELGQQLQRLKTLQQQGLISQEDYDAKKKQLLGL